MHYTILAMYARGAMNIMNSKFRLLSITIVFVSAICVVAAVVANRFSTTKNMVMSPPRQTSIDFASLVDSLANRNAEPTIVGGWSAAFDARYDFSEQVRIDRAIDVILIELDEAWPHLIEHLGDRRYSYTIGFDETTYNYSVSDVCEQVIHNAFEHGYASALFELEGTTFRRRDFFSPELYETERLKEWLQKKKEKKVYEIQMEVLEMVLRQAERMEIPDEKKQMFIKRVAEEIDDLQTTKQFNISRRFIPFNESWTYFKAEDAEIRR